ncbi:GNAT family N-acetyltransferase [Longimicrobium sp.]|uniref:GNAT family N-acetyltransferase n=1 Tax=Longimicrobium sp. TaxID=2029185 RepID=UPI002E2EED04|nr:GNAT family N-acetyltransferase [Longimicrobium sp.]HEX6039318.1 GNAT family N-acetyltransferase [Longimicrobium sp.]
MLAPTIETERLVLRAHTLADLDDCVAMWADPAVVQQIGGGRPSTAEETWARLLRNVGLWPMVGFGYWVIRERGTDRFVGEAGLADFRRDITPSLAGAPEAGWALATWAQGRGLGTEAVRAVVAWADAHLDAPRSVCMITPANAASIRVAEKCGYREFARTTYKETDVTLYERPRS